MKKAFPFVFIFFFVFFVLDAKKSFSQSYLGISSGNYSGVTGVSLQPASIADSRLKWDLNLFSIDVNYNNNFFYIKKDAILKNKFFKSPYNSDFDAVKRDLLEVGTESNEPVYVRMNSTIQLPSVMITTGKKSAIALNLRSRTFMQIDNMSPQLARMIYEDFQYEPYMGQTFNMRNVRTDIVSWLEAGFTYARVLYNDGQNFFKFGITGKYLGGIASGYMNSDQINFAFNSDSTISVNSDNVNYGHSSEFDLDFANRKDYSPETSAFSYDIGLVYEYRGNIDAFSFWKYNEEGDPELAERRDKNKYLIKIGISYLNGGRLDFTKPSNVNNFSVNVNNYDYGNVHAHNIKEVDSAIASVVNLKDADRNYTVTLPQVLSAQVDLKLTKGFYLNMMGYFPLDNSDTRSSIQAVRTFAVTPRWENRWFGIYIPLSFNEFHDTRLGAAVRLGPLYVGSSNFASVLFKDKLKSADFHLGLKIPVGFGKPSKAMRAFKRITQRNSVLGTQQQMLSNRSQNIFVLQKANDSLRNEIDQLKQKIEEMRQQPAPAYQPPHIPITININNYTDGSGSNKTEVKRDHKTIEIDSTIRQRERLHPQPGYKRQQYDYQQSDTLNYNFNNSYNDEAPAPSDSMRYYNADTAGYDPDATLYERMQQQNRDLKNELQQLRNQLQQQQVDSQKNAVMKKQLDTLMQMINEQNSKIQSIEDSVEKKKVNPDSGNAERSNIRQQDKADDAYEKRMELLQERLADLEDLQKDLDRQNRQLRRRARDLNDDRPEVRIETHPEYTLPERKNNVSIVPVLPFNAGNGRSDQTPVADTVYRYDTVYANTPPSDTLTSANAFTTLHRDTVRIVDTVEAKPIAMLADLPAIKVYFSTSNASIDQRYYPELDFVVSRLKQNDNYNIEISGYTDDSGPAEFNLQLSKKRANAVKQYLLDKGIRQERIITSFYGEDSSASPDNKVNSRTLNRKVEIKFVEKD